MPEERPRFPSDPGEIRKLDPDQLTALCGDIRAFLIERISQTGGHLSSNLGVVELTLAIHRSFDSPRDKIVFDVGHQAYVHKILTGRADSFENLRQTGGLSGYPSREESPHDLVENSHASTSLSYALGLAVANPDQWVIAVIGDGALTGGMAYEAFNHISHVKPPNLIVVINDNGRSYAPTVGGLTRFLGKVRTDPRYEGTKKALGAVLREVPVFGDDLDERAFRLKESLKQIVHPSTYFDVLGLKYTGEVDGHNLEELHEVFERAKDLGETVVVHAVTMKGRGYQPAIEDTKDMMHGVGKFDVDTGLPLSKQARYTNVFGEALAEAATRHSDVVAITAAMESSTGLSKLALRSPERVFDVGISEQHAVTLAAGLAMGGLRPVVAIYSTFLQRAFDQIMMDVALHQLPVVFAIDRAGVTGPDGSSHHGVFDLSYLRMVPHMAIASPSDATELCGLLETALTVDQPVAIRFPRASVSAMPDLPVEAYPFGQWEIVANGGSDVLLLATGRLAQEAEKAFGRLAEQGVSATVINARWIKPMDPRLEEWANAHDRIVTIEDNVIAGGFGAGVAEFLAHAGIDRPLTMLGIDDEFLPFGDPATILAEQGLDADGIVKAVLSRS